MYKWIVAIFLFVSMVSWGFVGREGELASEMPADLSAAAIEEAQRVRLELKRRHVDPRVQATNSDLPHQAPFPPLDWSKVKSRIYEQDDSYFLDHAGFRLELTIQPDLHDDVNSSLRRERHVGAGLVLIESETGAIRGIAERGGDFGNPLNALDDQVTTARAPAASLMKIVTAVAAIEKSGVEPSDLIRFRGGCQHLRRRNWLKHKSRDTIKMSLAQAFGHSCNTAFARLAIYDAGLGALRDVAHRFFLNRPIPSDVLLETSLAALPQLETATTFDVGEAGAGFGFSKLSPVHAALLSAAIANGGDMMAPFLVQRAFDANDEIVYEATPKVIGRVMSEKVAEKMMVLMKATVRSGTSRSHFLRRSTRKHRKGIGGKTGTLRDMEDRGTLYTWFSGVAPLPRSPLGGDGSSDRDRSLSVGVVVASPNDWLVRASSMAQHSFAHYYRLDRQKNRLAKGRKK